MRPPGSEEESGLSRLIRRTLLGTVIVVSLVLFALWRADNPRLERLRMSVVDAVAPPMTALNRPVAAVGEMTRDWQNFFDVYNQNRELRREIQRLHAWRETARQLEEENAQLRALNNVKLAPRTTFVTGDVIADSGGPFRQSALVNVGARDGVVDGAAAVDGAGLVGRVAGLGDRASRLLLVTDFSSRIPVVIQPGGQRAILAGDGTAAPKLDFIGQDDEVRPGDLVETSGDGSVFPPDLPVGQAVAVEGNGWRVALSSDFSRLEFVRLLRFRPDTRIDRPGGLILRGPEGAALGPVAPAADQPADRPSEAGGDE